MNVDVYFPLLLFIGIMVGTPGPANMLLLLGGAQKGFRECSQFILGLILGKLLINILIGLGFGVFLSTYPLLAQIFKYISAAYIIWIALKSWQTNSQDNIGEKHGKFSFLQGLIVHPINPKAWVMCILAWSSYGAKLGGALEQFLSICLSFMLIQVIFHSLWCWCGYRIGIVFNHNKMVTNTLIVTTVLVVLWVIFL